MSPNSIPAATLQSKVSTKGDQIFLNLSLALSSEALPSVCQWDSQVAVLKHLSPGAKYPSV